MITMFEKLEKRIIIDYKVIAISDLHVGGHESTAPAEVDNPVIKDSRGYPIIPGSSLKGVLRSEMERLMRGLGERACTPDNLCDPREVHLFSWSDVPGNDNVRLLKFLMNDYGIIWAENAEIRKSDDSKTIYVSNDENSAEIVIDEIAGAATLKVDDDRTHVLKINKKNGKSNICRDVKECTICLLFGGREYAGSIRIRDATATTQRTTMRDGVSIDRKSRKAAENRYYGIEVVPSGVEFNGELMIENPKLVALNPESVEFEYAKLGAFLSLVRFFNATGRALGGAVSRGFGEVLLVPTRIREITARDYLNGDYNGSKTPQYMDLTDELIVQLRNGEMPMKGIGKYISDWQGYLQK